MIAPHRLVGKDVGNMWNRISTALVLVYIAMPSCANVQAPALWQEPALSDFNVTDGTIKRSSDDRFVVESSEMRAVLTSGIHRAARADFTYASRTSVVSKLADGEIRSQFGLKLRAHDPCNLVYVMWWFEPQQKVAVSVKYNPGMATSQQCGDRGYLNKQPAKWAAPPPVKAGEYHSLRAQIHSRDLSVYADDNLVWQGDVGQETLTFDGPVGVRSDNARLFFKFLVAEGEAR